MNKIITILFLILFLLARADLVLAESLVKTISIEQRFHSILANPKTNKVYILSWVFSNDDSKAISVKITTKSRDNQKYH